MGQLPSTDCERMRGYVSASVDGELSEVEQAMIEAHLAWCPACRAFAAGSAETARVLRESPLEELTFQFALPGRRRAVARKLQVVGVAAAIAVAVGVGSTLGQAPVPSAPPSVQGAPVVTRWSTETELKMLRSASARRRIEHARRAL
jgi:anti-sigma factor RsiW